MRDRALKLGLFLLSIAAVLGGRPLQAKILDTYDLDSTAYMSTDIVEADITTPLSSQDRPHIPYALDARVTNTFKGSLKSGDTIALIGTVSYAKSKDGFGSNTTIRAGDKIVLFCSRVEPGPQNDFPKGAVAYCPVPGGVRLLQDGKAYPYEQICNPGPYIAMTPDDGFKGTGTPLPTLRSEIAASVRVADRYKKLLASPETASDPDTLLKLLKTRHPAKEIASFVSSDQIAEDIERKIADLKNPEVADAALQFKGRTYPDFTLEPAFNTPEGREYLLKHIADPHVALENRIRLAWTLPEAISAFGERTGPDAHYMARIA